MMRRSKNTTQEEETNEDSLQENDESKEILYFEQVLLHGAYYRIGDCVLVFNPKKGQCDVMQISRIWQTPDNQGRFFSGMFFARPKEAWHIF
jgi:ethanolamine ammonia-lyase large subunit